VFLCYNLASSKGEGIMKTIDLIKEAKNYTLSYNDTLDLPMNYTFGVEIEFNNLKLYKAEEMFKDLINRDYDSWNVKEEGTIHGDFADIDKYEDLIGGEVSSHIMSGTRMDWYELKRVCLELAQAGAITDEVCASHVHFDKKAIIDAEVCENLILLYAAYEDAMLGFLAAEQKEPAKFACAEPIRDAVILKSHLSDLVNPKSFDTLMDLYEFDLHKDRALRFCFLRSTLDALPTIEFRRANGTLSPEIWQNLILFYNLLLKYANSRNYDLELIKNHLEALNEDQSIYKFIELLNLITNDEEQKISFLKQKVSQGEELLQGTLLKRVK